MKEHEAVEDSGNRGPSEKPAAGADRRYELELELAASREDVWRALTDAQEIARWFAPRAEVVPGTGGRLLWDWTGVVSWPHRIEVWEPPRHLRTRHDSAVPDERGGKKPLFLDFFISAAQGAGGGTTLRIVHSGFGPEAAFDEEFDGVSRGWSIELLSLRHYLERHLGRERTLAWSIAPIGCAPEEAWSRLCSKDGLGSRFDLDAAREGAECVVALPGGASIEGPLLRRPARCEFAALAKNLGDGFFRVAVERCKGEWQVWLWLALYGDAGREAPRFQRAFDALASRLFPAREQVTDRKGRARPTGRA